MCLQGQAKVQAEKGALCAKIKNRFVFAHKEINFSSESGHGNCDGCNILPIKYTYLTSSYLVDIKTSKNELLLILP